jgi:carotenoid cleavage dioxygenase-like enzyme
MKHMFDGLALVSRVRFAGGQAYASQRYLTTDAYTSKKRTGERPLAVRQQRRRAGEGLWQICQGHMHLGDVCTSGVHAWTWVGMTGLGTGAAEGAAAASSL